MVEKKLKLLEQNLLKRNELLDDLYGLCDRQVVLLDDPDMEVEVFDACMDEQDELVQELIVLTEDAETLCEFFQKEKISADGPYAGQIECMQPLIAQVINKTNSLQEKEQIKKQKLNAYFECERKVLGSGRRSSKAALDYYKSMNRSNVVPPQFMDQKK